MSAEYPNPLPNEGESTKPPVTVETIAPDGIGYGDGSISRTERLRRGDLTPEIDKKASEAARNPQCLVPVSEDENGVRYPFDICSDGRCTSCIEKIVDGKVEQVDLEEGPRYLYKLLGGGLVMATAGRIGNGAKYDELMDYLFSTEEILDVNQINFGLHTSTHKHEGQSGCGAIDNFPVVLQNVVKYKQQIEGTLKALFGQESSSLLFQESLNSIFDEYETIVSDADYQEKIKNYRGEDVVGNVAKKGYIVKELDGDHNEVRVVFNIDVDGYTIDQSFVRKETDDRAQVFVVDVPRMKEIVDDLFDEPEQKTKALLSMMAYSLATVATLTDGSLPVDKVYKKYPTASAVNFKNSKKS